jgi:hypothetical protein
MYMKILFYYIYSVQLLLGYLPTDRGLWPNELEKKRSQYGAYKEEFLLNPVSLRLLVWVSISDLLFFVIFILGQYLELVGKNLLAIQ